MTASDANEDRAQAVAAEVLAGPVGLPNANRDCPYCQAGHRRHSTRGPGHWHTIRVRCWDQSGDATPEEAKP